MRTGVRPRTVVEVHRSARLALAGDLLMAAASAAAIIAITLQIPPNPGERAIDRAGYAVILLATLPLAARRLAPRVVLAAVAAALLAYTWRSYAGGPVYLVLAVPLYTLAATAPNRRAALTSAGVAIGALMLGGLAVSDGDEVFWHLATFPGWAGAALFLGDA
ncbi:MAG: hypothetical protein ACRD0M_02835, partial [Acidimicrobiales bacterium]